MSLLSTSFPIILFLAVLLLIAFEVCEKSIVALFGAALLLLMHFLTLEEAITAIDFETIILLLSMMLLVAIAKKSGIFAWLNVKLISLTRGNPLAIYILFALITALFSAFLDNVTTILIIVPITIELMRGIGQNPKPLVLGEIFLSNLGGAMTLIGDPPNIIIGGATGLSFNDFIVNLWIPTSISIVVVLGILIALHWKELKPSARDCRKLFLTLLLIRHLKYKFVKTDLSVGFLIKSISVLLLTLTAFFFQEQLGLNTATIALAGGTILALLVGKKIHLHETLHDVEWSTLLFFAGLFVLVGGVEHTGALEQVSYYIVNSTSSFPIILLLVLWASGFVSMLIDNIPFVTIMIPVIMGIQTQLTGEPSVALLWWALSLGACIGGNGSMIGASANVVGCDIARRHGVEITFGGYLKQGLPLTLLALVICSVYLLARYYLAI